MDDLEVPKMGVPLNHPFLDRIFHDIDHPAVGVYPDDYGTPRMQNW